MAKNSMIARELKRSRTVKRYAARRDELKAVIKNPNSSVEERDAAQLKLQALPRDSSPARQRNRCLLCGRPRGYMRQFRTCRICFRTLASKGEIPGVTKASW